MAAAIATIRELRETDATQRMRDSGQRPRDGWAAQAGAHGFEVVQTRPVQMPLPRFVGDRENPGVV